MSVTLPTPPAGSPFRVGYDEQGRVRLSWRPPYHWRSDLVTWLILTGLASLVVFLLYRSGERGLAICLALSFAITKLILVLRHGRWERLLLGPTVLRYDGSDPSSLDREARGFSLAEAEKARLEWVTEPGYNVPRQCLVLGWGTERVEIGRWLRRADREWLAEVLRTWARAEERPAGPQIPNAIRVEYAEDGVHRLYWKPNSLGLLSARRKTVVCLSTWLVGWGFGGVGLLVPTVIFLLALLLWGSGFWACLPLAGLVCPLWEWASAGHKAIRELRPLLREPTEESLTLTPLALHYRPGSCFDPARLAQLQECFKEPMKWRPGRYSEGQATHSDPAREVPLAEIGAVRLERTDPRPRLLIEHGTESFEVGRTLPEPDREWLAGVLRAWAGIPAEEDRAGRDGDRGELIKADRAVEQHLEPATETPRRK